MSIKVCVGNWGYYNEGELHDAWIELPKQPEEIKSFLEDRRLLDDEHEEIYISDYDGVPFGLNDVFTEYTRLSDLNLLAAQLENTELDEDAIAAYCNSCDAPKTVIELMNLIEQREEIPFYRYEEQGRTPRESMGITAIDWNPQLKAVLASDPDIDYAFDYEVYGESFEQQFDLYENGYFDCCADYPLLDAFDRERFEEELDL